MWLKGFRKNENFFYNAESAHFLHRYYEKCTISCSGRYVPRRRYIKGWAHYSKMIDRQGSLTFRSIGAFFRGRSPLIFVHEYDGHGQYVSTFVKKSRHIRHYPHINSIQSPL
jgi:hypothetical protein